MVATNAACHFFDPSSLPVMCHRDEDEWVGCVCVCVCASPLSLSCAIGTRMNG